MRFFSAYSAYTAPDSEPQTSGIESAGRTVEDEDDVHGADDEYSGDTLLDL